MLISIPNDKPSFLIILWDIGIILSLIPYRLDFMKIIRPAIILFILFVTACAAPYYSEPVQENGEMDAEITNTATATLEPSETPTITPTSSPTATKIPPTITPTPFAITSFESKALRKGVVPVQYIKETCSYLENRWGEGKSAPGTIVVPIMFHSIVKPGRSVVNYSDMSLAGFEYLMAKAKSMGFSTITTEELIGFLESNEKIPEYALMLILDDRRPGVTEEYFMPYLQSYDWTLTLAWLTTEKTFDHIWDRMERLAETGRLDVQSHGHESVYIQSYTPNDIVEEELYTPIGIIQEHFGNIPLAHIWSGGNFTEQSIEMAHEAGYRIGFTAYSRGPLLFNWIPQGEVELTVADPLMVLPRYWSPDLDVSLNHAVSISEEAKQHADTVKEEELLFIELYCQGQEGD